MDTSETLTTNAKTSSVLAPSTTAPSVIVSLHPLVIMNISEHWTRVRAQLGRSTKGTHKGTHALKIANYIMSC